jgi:DNA repair exonuclease SbcCD ATPase subunit
MATLEELEKAAKAKNYDPNSPEWQAYRVAQQQAGQQKYGMGGTVDPNKLLVGLAKPGGGVWGQSVQSGTQRPATTQPGSTVQQQPAQPAFDMQGFLNSFNQSQAAIAEANRKAQEAQNQNFLTWQNTMQQQQAERDAAARAQVEDYNRRMAEQQQKQYEQQLFLNEQQISAINQQKATIEKALRDAAARFEAGKGEQQARTQTDIAQVVRNYAAERAKGLSNLAARNRGIDPSASGRFLSDLAAGRAGALAQTQTSGFDALRQLKEALDAQQYGGLSSIAELNRLSTQLGTNLTNLFPGVSF